MKRWIYSVFLFMVFACKGFASDPEEAKPDKKLPSRVTYQLGEGGFGSQLLTYMHAKWISHTNKIPLLYKSFPHANQLKMHSSEEPYSKKRWKETVVVNYDNDVVFMDPNATLYVVPFLEETHFNVNWENKTFKKILKKMCAPEKSVESIKIPKGRVSVAVHVRTIQGEESPELSTQKPLKFPSHEYYIRQIHRLYNNFRGMPMYVHLFTNDPNPESLLHAYKSALNHPNIVFECSKSNTQPKMRVVSDFHNMTRFSCLIASESSFSKAAEAIADYLIVIRPAPNNKVHIKLRKKD